MVIVSAACVPLEAKVAVRPRWHADALCREHPELSWYPPPGASDRLLRAICGMCLVSSECLAFAMANDEDGIWGGTSANERRKLRRTSAWPARQPRNVAPR